MSNCTQGQRVRSVSGLVTPDRRAGEVDTEAGQPGAQKQNPLPKAKQPQPNHPGWEKLPEHLERLEEIIPCGPEDCRCSQCGAERPVTGYEAREELAYEPAQFWVRVIKREKRGSHCLPEQGVVTAGGPGADYAQEQTVQRVYHRGAGAKVSPSFAGVTAVRRAGR